MVDSKLISDAEWEIMRIIWAKAPVTSTVIIKDLEGITGWMPTTVKTLLSRLVNKQILEFETKGRTFYYSPLVTEEKCIRDEMQNVVEKVYGGTLNHETTHFVFKGMPDMPYVMKLAESLENSYEKITTDLKQTLQAPLLVYTHATQKRLHSALGVLEGPEWLRAGYLWGILHIAPLSCFHDLPAENAAVHTFTQLLIQQINPSTPYWLQQAVATYESDWMTHERIQLAVKTLLEAEEAGHSKSIHQMQVMKDAYLAFKDTKGYELGYTVIEFIVSVYGCEKVAEFIRQPHDFLAIFGESESEFWSKWRGFIAKIYS